MDYNFDEIIDRRGTSSVKHDGLQLFFGADDLLPMWVADMDFRTPQCILDAVKERCNHPVMGYTLPSEAYYKAVKSWLHKLYSIDATEQELHFIPGIVAGIAFAIQALTAEGDGVMVFTPVYPPFINLPRAGARRLECSPLIETPDGFRFDWQDVEQRIVRCKLVLLSNPHNPAGTVWPTDDLVRLAALCKKHGVTVISDEIHADMTLPPRRHTSFSTLSSDAKEVSVSFMSPSKTFNMAGLSSSVSFVPNDTLRRRFYHYLNGYEVAGGNLFAFVGAEAALREGGEAWAWRDAMLDYLAGNVRFMEDYVSKHLPLLRVMMPQASYLAWMNFSAYGYSHEEMARLLLQSKLALNDGTSFGGERYANCFRLNLGCPRSVLRLALDRIAAISPSAT